MDFVTYSFRHADVVLREPGFIEDYTSIIRVIQQTSDVEIVKAFEEAKRKAKSVSESINNVFKGKFIQEKWIPQAKIFKDEKYTNDKTWRLDFAKNGISVEVAFNHGEAVAWNLIKPVLASELNHVQKAIQTRVGIIITATDHLKKEGGFDNAVAPFEKFIEYLKPLNNLLTVPVLIIGLSPFKTFSIRQESEQNKKIGKVQYKML